jgi:hypothetical protein
MANQPGINFNVANGQLGTPLDGEDHISGFITYKNELPAFATLTAWVTSTVYALGVIRKINGRVYECIEAHTSGTFATDLAAAKWIELTDLSYRCKAIFSLAEAETAGIIEGDANWGVLWYHLYECFRINPKAEVNVYIAPVPASTYDFAEITALRAFTGGRVRQVAIYAPALTYAKAQVGTIQALCNTARTDKQPLSVLYAANFAAVTDWSAAEGAGGADSLALLTSDAPSVSVVIGQDGAARGAALYTALGYSITCIGALLGAVSRAKVNYSIAWVSQFQLSDGTELNVPALANGQLWRTFSVGFLDALHTKRFIFIKKFTGNAGTYFNDDHTATALTNDYAYISRTRAIDKAIRSLYARLLPEVNAPVLVNATTGRLSREYIEYLKGLGDKALGDMVGAGELSGGQTVINPTQNVNSTSLIVVGAELVPIGVSRTITVNIGFKTQLS